MKRNTAKRFLAGLTCLALFLLPAPIAWAADALPDPDGQPADMTKPVQVYILMGQSNMVGSGV
ncbi:MAG: hypothetical protein AB8C95_05375, partial [Phycisphaeraceae bacterium]